MKKIEFVHVDEIGKHVNGKREIIRLASICYQDGAENRIPVDGPCVAYLEDGFLTKVEGAWNFYDVEGKLIKTVPTAQFGECREVSYAGFYIFNTNGENEPSKMDETCFALSASGERIKFPDRWMGLPIADLYPCGGNDFPDDEDEPCPRKWTDLHEEFKVLSRSVDGGLISGTKEGVCP